MLVHRCLYALVGQISEPITAGLAALENLCGGQQIQQIQRKQQHLQQVLRAQSQPVSQEEQGPA